MRYQQYTCKVITSAFPNHSLLAYLVTEDEIHEVIVQIDHHVLVTDS